MQITVTVLLVTLTSCIRNPFSPDDKVATPTIDPPGGLYNLEQQVSMHCSTQGAVIRFTTDGSEPDMNSPAYLRPFMISNSTTIKAKGFKGGYKPSEVASSNYTFTFNGVRTPSISPPGGKYHTVQYITISCSTWGASIRYTTDGTDPGPTSPLYDEPLYIVTSTTVKARGFKEGMTSSPAVCAIYDLIFDQTVATPVISPEGSYYSSVQIVSLHCPTPGSLIRYTIDGTEPNSESRVYSVPLSIAAPTTIKARGFKDGMTPSATVTSRYSVLLDQVEMVSIPGGSCYIGNTIDFGDEDEHPVHLVTLSPFYLGKYEVTQKQWQDVMGSLPILVSGVGDNLPIYNISQYEMLKYCNLRSMAEGLTPVYYINNSTDPNDWGEVPYDSDATWNAVYCAWSYNGYCLPTEAEWEYAARSAQDVPNYRYSGSNDLNSVAWYADNSTMTHPVGHKLPNDLGIYDMCGNVSELCWDPYSDVYYSFSPLYNPHGPSSGGYKVCRGGYFDNDADQCRLANRSYQRQAGRGFTGFRLRRRA